MKKDQHKPAMSSATRREFLRGAGLGLLSFSVAGTKVLVTPREARARGADFHVLKANEIDQLEAFAEVLVPGARAAGVANFVDQQLSINADDALLMVKYFNVRPPYADFYRDGLAAVNAFSMARHGKQFSALGDADAESLVASFSGTVPDGWNGPPAPLVYMAVRADAVDVVYGTVEGFERLNVPYMPHILPPSKW
jgi:hypothetical protein